MRASEAELRRRRERLICIHEGEERCHELASLSTRECLCPLCPLYSKEGE